MNDPAAPADDQKAIGFLARQMEQFGGNMEVESNVWALFAVAAKDPEENAAAQELLAGATFAYQRGESEDDAWIVYCVNGADRAAATFWLDDTHRKLSGQIRNLSPSQISLLDELGTSPTPHRIARSLADLRSRGEIGPGAVRRPDRVRHLLDRLHAIEPLYFSAFQTLLEHHLIDLFVLNQKLLDEDIWLGNDLMRGSVSKDPFFQARQTSAARIREHLVRCHIINPIDQQKSAPSNNPYESVTDTHFAGDEVILRIDGIDKTVRKPDFLSALRAIRKVLYRGNGIGELSTHTPWITEETAYPFRFIQQRINSDLEISSLDWLYMLERAVDPGPLPGGS